MLAAIRSPAFPAGHPHEAAMHHLYALLARIALALVLGGEAWAMLADAGALAGLAGLAAALALLAGAWTRPAALALAVLVLAPALGVPAPGEPQQVIELARSLFLGGGLVLLAAHGADDFSFDAWRRARASQAHPSRLHPGGAH